jgi:hypothetical protein
MFAILVRTTRFVLTDVLRPRLLSASRSVCLTSVLLSRIPIYRLFGLQGLASPLLALPHQAHQSFPLYLGVIPV